MVLNNTKRSLIQALQDEDYLTAANLVVDSRISHFTTSDGLPDYRGTSYAYRSWYGEILDSLNLDKDERSKLAGRMRFHVGNVLRQRVDSSTLQEFNLKVESPKERGTQNYNRRSEPYNIISSDDPAFSDEDIDDVVLIISKLSSRVETEKLSDYANNNLMESLKDFISKVEKTNTK